MGEGDLQPVEDLVSGMECDLSGFGRVAAQVRAFYGMDMLAVVHGAERDPRAEARLRELVGVVERYLNDRPGLLSRLPGHLTTVFGGRSPLSVVDQVHAHARDLNPGTWVIMTYHPGMERP